MTVFKIIVSIFAIILIVIGIVTAITPIPFGLPLIVIGFLMLATISPATLRFVRRRWGWLDRRLKWFQRKLPRWMARPLRRSDPHPDEEDDEKAEEAGGNSEADVAGAEKRAAIAEILRRRG